MSKNAKIAAGGVAVGLILLFWLPWWVSFLIVVGVPAAAYLTLDPSQRRRLRRTTRKELGR
jgi:membrane protein implicated in regulation of membrane protease activity